MGKIDFNIGEFDTLVCFYRQDTGRTASGAVTKAFNPVRSAYARLSCNKLGEEIGEGQVAVIEMVEIVSYLDEEVDNSWRVGKDKAMYEIISVEPIRRRFMKIIAKRLYGTN